VTSELDPEREEGKKPEAPRSARGGARRPATHRRKTRRDHAVTAGAAARHPAVAQGTRRRNRAGDESGPRRRTDLRPPDPARRQSRPGTLFHRQPDDAGRPRRSAEGLFRRCQSSARRCLAISAGLSSMRRSPGKSVPTSAIAMPNPGVARRSSDAFRKPSPRGPRASSLRPKTRPPTTAMRRHRRQPAAPQTDLAGLGLAPQPSTTHSAGSPTRLSHQTPDKRHRLPDRVAAPASANVLQAGAVIAAQLSSQESAPTCRGKSRPR